MTKSSWIKSNDLTSLAVIIDIYIYGETVREIQLLSGFVDSSAVQWQRVKMITRCF